MDERMIDNATPQIDNANPKDIFPEMTVIFFTALQ